MPSTPLESSRGVREEAKAPDNGKPAEAKATPAAPAAGAIKAWLPLAVAVVAMPALAYATTQFVLLPKIKHALIQASPAPPPDSATEPDAAAKNGDKAAPEKLKTTVSMNKMLVNVAGTMGTRYLMTSITLVGSAPEFKNKIEDNKDQLMDLATGTLSGKTISDLEKPGARNVIRAELLTVFNNALGGPLVQEIYITELAIQ